MSRHKGAHIAGTQFKYLDEGAYGTVFVDRSCKRIRKLYRCGDKPEEHCREVFNSEMEALDIAISDDTLSQYVIGPVVRIDGYKVLNDVGYNVTEDFLDNAGFEGEFVEGTFQKIVNVNAHNKNTLTEAFRAAGVDHVIDASVTLDREGNIKKIIDFGMRDIEFWC